MNNIKETVDKALPKDYISASSPVRKIQKIERWLSHFTPTVTLLIGTLVIAALTGLTSHFVYRIDKRIDNLEVWQRKTVVPFITETSEAIKTIKTNINKFGTKLLSLEGTFKYGYIVLYEEGLPTGYSGSTRVCALSTTFPWGCDRDVLRKYIGNTVYISVHGKFDSSLDFRVIGYFPPNKEDGRMVQIPRDCVANLVGKDKAAEYIKQGTIYGKVSFPKR